MLSSFKTLKTRPRRPACAAPRLPTVGATAAAILAGLVLAACGGGGDDTTAADASGASPAQIECQSQAYPCTWKQVASAVIARSRTLAAAMDSQLVAHGSTRDAAAWLKQQEPAVVVQYDEQVIRFRLRDGRPMWVAGPGVLRAPAAAGEQLPAAAVAAKAPAGQPDGRRALGVVAPGAPGKRALVLAPYAFELAHSSADIVAEILETTPGYEQGVAFKANRTSVASDVEIDSYRDFANYDVIHVDTHGWQLCHDLETGEPIKPCKAFISAKELNNQIDLVEQDNVGVEVIHMQGRTQLILTTDFFRHTYPGGLADRLFYFDACSPTGNAAIAAALGGSRSAFFGWKGAVRSLWAIAMARHMFSGLQAGRRLQDVLASAGPSFVQPDGTHAVTDGGDLRIRELIHVNDAQTGERVADGKPLLVAAMPGDGQSDSVLLDIVVDGVEAALVDKFVLTVFVDGQQRKQLTLGDAEMIGEYRRRVAAEVPLGFDAKADQALKLKFVVTLPEGGTSTLEVTPKIDDPSKLPAQYEMTSHVHMPLIGGDRYMTAKVLWELEPDQDPSKPYRYYRVVGGSLSWTHKFKLTRDKDDCTLEGGGTLEIVGGDSRHGSVRIDFSGTPTLIYAGGLTPKQSAYLKGVCWGEEMVVETSAGGTYLNVSGVAIDPRVPFNGTSSTGSKLPVTIAWSFTPVGKNPAPASGAVAAARQSPADVAAR